MAGRDPAIMRFSDKPMRKSTKDLTQLKIILN
jgi:hypothetical protein